MTNTHPQLWTSPDFFHGVAGWGLGQLKFFLSTGDERYLAGARKAGEYLIRTRVEEDTTGSCHWRNGAYVHCGLGHGSAGVSLFLLYLSLVTGDDRFLTIGRRALTHVLQSAVPNPDGGSSWLIDQSHVTRTSYWRWGSAGVGMCLVRYNALLNDPTYSEALELIHLDTDRKFAIFPGQHTGLAGIGEFYLDWSTFQPGDARLPESAKRLLSGVLLFKLQREAGIAFPSETRTHITCDFGTGSAGIGFFVHRLVYGGDAAFMLDEAMPALSGTRADITTRKGSAPNEITRLETVGIR